MKFPVQLDDTTELRLLEDDHAPILLDLIERNRESFDYWMRWTGRVHTMDDIRAFIVRHRQRYEDGIGFHAGIWYSGQLAGGIVCHNINHESKKTEIGYYLDADFRNKGLVTKACRAVLGYLFGELGLHRVEIQCDVDNMPSRGVAERLGFIQEGTLRESEWLTTRFADHALYSLLDREWQSG